MAAYYNENDPFAAAWLRELINKGLIAYGIVDERDIRDVRPRDLAGFTQCHFFAGIGVWSYALRKAGWPDSRPIWTGSYPCQPFSAAGKGAGFTDERHLWPAWFHLITTAKPDVVPVLGEQVASKDGLAWLDLVQADMEAAGHAFGAVDLCAAGVGAPHIRQRLWFVGYPRRTRPQEQRRQGDELAGLTTAGGDGGMEYPEHEHQRPAGQHEEGAGDASGAGKACGLANSEGSGLKARCGDGMGDGKPKSGLLTAHGSEPSWMADAGSDGRHQRREQPGIRSQSNERREETERRELQHESAGLRTVSDPRPAGQTTGFWRAADWLFCRDGKWRPVEPGTFPLVDGAPARVGRLRGYGNAINAEAAAAFIEAAMQ